LGGLFFETVDGERDQRQQGRANEDTFHVGHHFCWNMQSRFVWGYINEVSVRALVLTQRAVVEQEIHRRAKTPVKHV
jgi:hypothetical protein